MRFRQRADVTSRNIGAEETPQAFGRTAGFGVDGAIAETWTAWGRHAVFDTIG